MLVHELMVEDVITVDRETTVREAVATMLEAHVGSVIVEEDSIPVGIFTGTDALVAGYDCDCAFSDISVERAMSDDLVTGSPDMTVRSAADTMSEAGVRKLPIVEDFEIVGIITYSDIVSAHSTLLQEASGFNVRRRKWSFEEEEE